MKRHLTFYILFLSLFALNAQEVKLTIETTAGGLKDAMTEEQRETVTDLSLTGSMNDADFYFIRDEMPKLENLDIKQVKVDTIPPKALYNKRLLKVILPINMKYIDNEAFSYASQEIILTGDFPRLGAKAFYEGKFTHLSISEDNKYCISIGLGIYSSDGKILYYFNDNGFGFSEDDRIIRVVEEGTEIIASRAFDNCLILQATFPSSLKKIEEHAFENARSFGIAGWPNDYPKPELLFQSAVPPVLAKDVLRENAMFGIFYLIVPKGSIPVYKDADEQWNLFMEILDSGSDVQFQRMTGLRTFRNENSIFVSSDKVIGKLSLLDMQGHPVYKSKEKSNRMEIPVSLDGIYLLEVIYIDDTTEIIKLNI